MNIGAGIGGAASGFASGGPWGAAIGGIAGLFGGSDPSQSQAAVDPYAPYRAQAATQLNDLMADPNSVTNLPGFKFLQEQGQQGVERAMSARGLTLSGNETLALQKQDQGLVNEVYNQQFDKLATLSGAKQSPADGGQAYNTAMTQQRDDLSQGIGALSGLFKNSGTGGGVNATNSDTGTGTIFNFGGGTGVGGGLQ